MSLKIIYLDDDLELLELFKAFYEADFEIKVFSVPEEAIQEINSNPPDLVVLDYRLPGTNGDIVAQSINENVPKILLTGDFNINTKSHFLRIFNKPYDYNELLVFLLDQKNLHKKAS